MKAFAELYTRLDATTSSNAKLAAMREYFEQAEPQDAAWAVYFCPADAPGNWCRPASCANRP